MAAFGGKRSLGIDVGSSGVKAVALTLARKEVRIEELGTHDTGAEGILNDAELYASLGEWLAARKWSKRALVFGLPQFVCTTQVSDFPAGSASGLEDMVAYETQQLAGLSEESFIHDYTVMQPVFGRKNPVLIGVCRESVVRDRIAAVTSAGMQPAALAMQGLAAVNALLWLQPEIVKDHTPKILLDVGREGATVAVVAAGQPLYVGSLDFGSYLYTRALAGKLKCDEGEAEVRKRQLDLTQEAPTSAVFQVTRKLESELQYAVEHWRAQERGELNEAPISGVWLCGGGARLGGLSEVLESRLDCPVRLFGPTDGAGGQSMPEHVAAFGLALQGLGRAPMDISLTPADFRWSQLRERRFPFLVAAAVWYTLLMAILLVTVYVRGVREESRLETRIDELIVCEGKIPELVEALQAIKTEEARMIPFVEKGNRARRFVHALDSLGSAIGDKDWFVYLADRNSYEQGKVTADAAAAQTVKKKGTTFSLFDAERPGALQGVGDTAVAPEFPEKILVYDVPLMTSLIAAGYTPLVPSDPYGAVHKAVAYLNQSDAYDGVDSLPERDRMGRADIFDPWLKFLRRTPTRLYKAFSLQLPLAQPDIVIPKKPDRKRE